MRRRQGKLATEESLRTLQQTNEELSHELTQLNRAVEAGVLSAGVVHEMNNPLAIIAGYADLLSRDLAALGAADQETAQHVKQRLASIQREIGRCKDIAHRFLNFSRSGPEASEIVGARKLLEDAAALIKAHPSNHGVEITFASADPDPQLKVNSAEILQVLINLGVNALHAMEGTGTLQLTAMRPSSIPPELAFRSESFDPQKPLVKIAVTDSGSGIAPRISARFSSPTSPARRKGPASVWQLSASSLMGSKEAARFPPSGQ